MNKTPLVHRNVKFLSYLLIFCFLGTAFADESREKVVSRIEGAGEVLDEIMAAPDKGIPQEVMGSADCVAVVPSMLKGGFVFGGEYGRGVATCRNSNGWSAPAFFRLGGGSFGLQIGGQAVDLVMLIMNRKGMQALLSSHFKLGVDASAAAGPVGRHAEGMTDWKMRAEVLTYSRARGLFAGVTLNGAAIKQDSGDTRTFYGHMIPFKRILTGGIAAPSEAQPFIGAVAKYNAGAAAEKSAEKAEPAQPSNAPAKTEGAPAVKEATPPPSESKPSPATETKAPEDPHR